MMKNIFYLIVIIMFMMSCNVFKPPVRYNEDGSVSINVRKFPILKKPFISNSLIDTEYFYTTFVGRSSENIFIYKAYGFLSDGRFIASQYSIPDNNEDFMDSLMKERNSWITSDVIGFYNTEDDNIEVQYYNDMPQTGGMRNDKGKIVKDSIYLNGVIYGISKYRIIW